MSARVERARVNLRSVVDRLRTDEFEPVHAGRWRQRSSGLHIETGYSYGEGVVRFYDKGNREMTGRVVLRGSADELNDVINKLKAPPSH